MSLYQQHFFLLILPDYLKILVSMLSRNPNTDRSLYLKSFSKDFSFLFRKKKKREACKGPDFIQKIPDFIAECLVFPYIFSYTLTDYFYSVTVWSTCTKKWNSLSVQMKEKKTTVQGFHFSCIIFFSYLHPLGWSALTLHILSILATA